MSKILFALLCGSLSSSLFWLVSFFAYETGWKLVSAEYLIFAAILGIVISMTAYSIPHEEQDQGL